MLKFKPGTVLSILSFTISLFILSCYLLVLIHLSNLIKIVNEKTPFIIELKDNTSEDKLASLKTNISGKEGIIAVDFISREEGLKIMEKQLGKDFILDENPLKDILKLKLSEKLTDESSIEKLKNEIMKNSEVENCYFEKDNIEDLRTNLSSLNSVLLIIALIFITLSFILIYNNLKFILHSDRFQIKSMELVGASPEFIKRPYIKFSLKIGAISGLLAVGITFFLLIFLNIRYQIFSVILDTSFTLIILLSIFLISLISPPVFINYLVNKYLKMSDEQRHR